VDCSAIGASLSLVSKAAKVGAMTSWTTLPWKVRR
jgi:hypothetical protein